jgi:multiple sugar transport system permease protein
MLANQLSSLSPLSFRQILIDANQKNGSPSPRPAEEQADCSDPRMRGLAAAMQRALPVTAPRIVRSLHRYGMGESSAAPFVAPALAVLAAVNLVPLLWSIGISFYHFRADRPHSPPHFLGFGNYVDLFTDDDLWEHFLNSGILIACSVGLQMLVGAGLALVFYKPFPGRRFILMLILAPMLLSTVAVGTFFSLFYDPTFGIVSALISPLTGEKFVPLGTPFSARLSLIIADAWMWSPFVMLMLLAGLSSVPSYLHEAAEIDRATPSRKFFAVILPSIRDVLMLALLFRTIESFNMFDLVYTITNGGPGTSTETVSTETYDTAFVLFESGRASALGNFSLFVIILLTNIYFRLVRQRSSESAR